MQCPVYIHACRVNGEPESLVISSQVARQGGAGDIDEVLEKNPAIITFSFQVVSIYITMPSHIILYVNTTQYVLIC